MHPRRKRRHIHEARLRRHKRHAPAAEVCQRHVAHPLRVMRPAPRVQGRRRQGPQRSRGQLRQALALGAGPQAGTGPALSTLRQRYSMPRHEVAFLGGILAQLHGRRPYRITTVRCGHSLETVCLHRHRPRRPCLGATVDALHQQRVGARLPGVGHKGRVAHKPQNHVRPHQGAAKQQPGRRQPHRVQPRRQPRQPLPRHPKRPLQAIRGKLPAIRIMPHVGLFLPARHLLDIKRPVCAPDRPVLLQLHRRGFVSGIRRRAQSHHQSKQAHSTRLLRPKPRGSPNRHQRRPPGYPHVCHGRVLRHADQPPGRGPHIHHKPSPHHTRHHGGHRPASGAVYEVLRHHRRPHVQDDHGDRPARQVHQGPGHQGLRVPQHAL